MSGLESNFLSYKHTDWIHHLNNAKYVQHMRY